MVYEESISTVGQREFVADVTGFATDGPTCSNHAGAATSSRTSPCPGEVVDVERVSDFGESPRNPSGGDRRRSGR